MLAATSTPKPPMAQGHGGPLLVVEGLRRSYGDRVALDGLSFSVGRGEIFGLLGPNGAGKTTTFHILAGLLAPEAGRILLSGRETGPQDPAYRARLGVVFQHPSLDLKLTARENLQLGAGLYALPRRVARERIEELLQLVDLRDRADELVEHYSGGMRRRLELARVLLHEPQILVLDEPSRGLDQPSLRRFWEQILELRARRGLTVLLTTHQPEEAEYCDRLGVLDGGRLVACDTPAALRKRVGNEMILVEGERPEELAEVIAERFDLRAPAVQIVDGRVVVETPRAHELVPRLVEAFPSGRLRSVSLRAPTLADVFVRLTGHGLPEAGDEGAV